MVEPGPVVEAVSPEPVVEVMEPGPVVEAVSPEPVVEVHKADVGATKTYSSGVEQPLVASLHQNAPVGAEMGNPLASSQGSLNNMSGDQSDVVNGAAKSIDVQSEPGATNSSYVVQEGFDEQPGASRKDGNPSSLSSAMAGGSINSDAAGTQDPVRSEFGQFAGRRAEEAEKVPDGSEDLAMPMVAGLVGAALEGSLRKKEKMTTLHGDSPTGEKRATNQQTSQESSPDDKEAPPRVA
jgi:hypothetical protein